MTRSSSRRKRWSIRFVPSDGGRLADRLWLGLVRTGASDSVSTGVRDGAMARVEVITGPERRRRWSGEQKQAIVAESLAPGAVVREIARRAEIGTGQIYRWRRQIEAGQGFAQVVLAPVGDDTRCTAAPAIEIEFAGKARMRIPASIPAGLAAAVVKALSGR